MKILVSPTARTYENVLLTVKNPLASNDTAAQDFEQLPSQSFETVLRL